MTINKKMALAGSVLVAALMVATVGTVQARPGSGHSGGHFSGGHMGRHMGGHMGAHMGGHFSGGGHWRSHGGMSHGFVGHRPHFNRSFAFRHHHRHHRHARVFAFAPFYDYGYGYADGCYWLRNRAISTGSRYWWSRYRDCVNGYDYY
jgi:hypothetical protein